MQRHDQAVLPKVLLLSPRTLNGECQRDQAVEAALLTLVLRPAVGNHVKLLVRIVGDVFVFYRKRRQGVVDPVVYSLAMKLGEAVIDRNLGYLGRVLVPELVVDPEIAGGLRLEPGVLWLEVEHRVELGLAGTACDGGTSLLCGMRFLGPRLVGVHLLHRRLPLVLGLLAALFKLCLKVILIESYRAKSDVPALVAAGLGITLAHQQPAAWLSLLQMPRFEFNGAVLRPLVIQPGVG